MSAEKIYQAGNDERIIIRAILYGIISVIAIAMWSYSPYICVGILVLSFIQIFLSKYSRMVVYEDRVQYEIRNLLGINTEKGTFHFQDMEALEYIPVKVDWNAMHFGYGLIPFLSRHHGKETQLWAYFVNGKRKMIRWRGSLLEIQEACEKANRIISLKFNRPKFQ